ncbi:hypothetical protein EQO05_07680 [Methanosarcina sp. MSH10X1]|uniref:hypothetical protein n=1 Tax=Methanosarcina sp. MSH10X1 TaxID=2507075 RepID=UPI000FFC16AA|nr:hypothetical protein [Methanosarcina sp. MSH10X1]RXA19724.1 hypothetical protein EQO05_07680 [Methanosarcina sp. MSH10X1]
MKIKDYIEDGMHTFSIAFPYFILLVVLGACLCMLIIGRFNSAFNGLVIAIPALISCHYTLNLKNEQVDLKKDIYISIPNSNIFNYLFWAIYFFSIVVLFMHESRPWYYFLLISFSYLIIFVQIFSNIKKPALILTELFFIMLNLIYSVTMNYGFYFGTTDLLSHIFMSKITYLSGHVIPISLSNYSYFPLYHILLSEASYLLNLDMKTSLFLITAPIYGITVVFIYSIFLKTSHNQQIALLSSSLYSLSSVVIYYGVNLIARTMAFIYFIIILYFVYSSSQGKNSMRFRILSILISISLILVHQVSIPQIVLLLSIVFISEWLTGNKNFLSKNYYVLINVMFISYWIFVAYIFITKDISSRLQLNYLDSVVLFGGSSGISQSEWMKILGYFDDSIFLFFALISIGYLLKCHKNNYASVFGLVALFTLIFYIPNPLNSVWQFMVLFRFDRIMLLVSPFMAFVMGVGIYLYLITGSKTFPKLSKSKFISVFTLIFIFSFVSLVSSVSDSDDLWINPQHEYFSNQELNGFNYISNKVPFGSILYSDYHAMRYFPGKFEYSQSLGVSYYRSKKIKNVDSLPSYNGYIVIRERELARNGLYFGENELESRDAPNYLYVGTPENQMKLYSKLKMNDKVYSNSAISVYYN